MVHLLGNAITDKLIKNSITFAFLLAGVLLGIGLVVLIYVIFVKKKAKPPKLLKSYAAIDPKDDPIILKAKDELYSLDTKKGIENYIVLSAQVIVNAVKEIAKEYTGDKRGVILDLPIKEKYPDVEFAFDTDFSVEDFLIFLSEVAYVVENTVLTITDKYSVLVNSFLKVIGFSGSIRTITIKDIVLYLNEKAEKKEKKLDKEEEKKILKEKAESEKLKKEIEKEREREEKQREREKQEKEKAKEKAKKDKKKKKDVPKFFLDIKEFFSPNDKSKKKPNKNKTDKKTNNKKKDDEKPKESKLSIKKKVKTEEEPKDKISSFYKPINKVITEVMEVLIVGICQEARKLYGRGYTTREQEELAEGGDQC